MMTENERTALVTGGSRGIGKAVALKLARDGYRVLLTYVSKPESADEVCREIESAGGQARAYLLDIGDREAIETFFSDEIKDKVRLDVLVNNAGMTWDGLIVRMKPEQWEKIIRVNLSGAFYCLQEAAKIMMRQKSGRIVNISSVVGQSGNPGQANYVSAKSAIIGLTKTAAQELAPRGITVNAVAPGFIATDMTAKITEDLAAKYLERIPLKKFGTADDIASAVSFLASEGAGYITGQVIGVNGGLYM
jgi:3-oxoacyl-[acyl-carrier protein] reductase